MFMVSIDRPGAAPCVEISPKQDVEFDFRETPLRDIVRWISCARSLNLMFKTSEVANRKITWVSSRKVKGHSLKRRFVAMLRSEGLRLRSTGPYLVIEARALDR